MTIDNPKDLGRIAIALLVSAAMATIAAARFPVPEATIVVVPVAALMLSAGIQAMIRAGETPYRRTSPIGMLVPATAWTAGGLIACCAPWQLLVLLNPIIGPSALPVAVLGSLCGTAGAILAGRWADMTMDPPHTNDQDTEATA